MVMTLLSSWIDSAADCCCLACAAWVFTAPPPPCGAFLGLPNKLNAMWSSSLPRKKELFVALKLYSEQAAHPLVPEEVALEPTPSLSGQKKSFFIVEILV